MDYIPWKTFDEFRTHLMLRLQPQQGTRLRVSLTKCKKNPETPSQLGDYDS